jgi:cyclase
MGHRDRPALSARRIIPCLDVKDGRVVKGVKFQGLRDAGDPAELAVRYEQEGADEVVFLDIGASVEGRAMMRDAVRRAAERLSIPLTVGGGVRSVRDVGRTLRSGADKVSLNTAAIDRPTLVRECSTEFGAQCTVLAIDARKKGAGWSVLSHGGTRVTPLDAVAWARRGVALGAGELLLTSWDADGTKDGYDLGLTRAVSRAVKAPVIASGGCGSMAHVLDAFRAGADAALAASVFHYREIDIHALKRFLDAKGVEVRL